MSAPLPDQPGAPIAEAEEYGQLFHHEGAFEDGAKIAKSTVLSGAERFLVVDNEDFGSLKEQYREACDKYGAIFPAERIFPNGMSGEQASRIVAVAETITNFNGGLPYDHTTDQNLAVYVGDEQGDRLARDGNATIKQFECRRAMMCTEMGLIAQQLLSDDEEMTYISGSVDMNRDGRYEGHGFNIIKPASEEYPAAILDVANPIETRQEDGTIVLTQYCAPLTAEQFEQFKNGDPVEVVYKDTVRDYSYSIANLAKTQW
ncbi:hypothetical protein GF389_02590 [Candidatus Dojkabacteria bacterium]|nr:hypothetical protein [Candidatus Dojkabacteria bacterium]